MPDLLLDRDWESGGTDTPWIQDGSAMFWGTEGNPQPFQGVWAGALYSYRGFGPGGIPKGGSGWRQTIITEPGKEYIPAGYIWNDTSAQAGGVTMIYRVDTNPGDGSNLVEYQRLGGTTGDTFPTDAWTLHLFPPFTAQSTQAQVNWFVNAPSVNGVNAYWFLDLFSIPGLDMAKRSRWLAHQALVTVLKGINGGSTYHTDLGNRVYTRLFVPGDPVVVPMPYLCLPLYGDAPRYQDDDTFLVTSWTVNIHGYVPEPAQASLDSTAVVNCYHLVEDIYKALLGNQTLNGTVNNLKVLDGGFGLAGVDLNPYGEFHVPLELTLFLGVDVLGP